eukprot:362294-Chlamydomonas_euryale.AAC.1
MRRGARAATASSQTRVRHYRISFLAGAHAPVLQQLPRRRTCTCAGATPRKPDGPKTTTTTTRPSLLQCKIFRLLTGGLVHRQAAGNVSQPPPPSWRSCQ